MEGLGRDLVKVKVKLDARGRLLELLFDASRRGGGKERPSYLVTRNALTTRRTEPTTAARPLKLMAAHTVSSLLNLIAHSILFPAPYSAAPVKLLFTKKRCGRGERSAAPIKQFWPLAS